MNGKSKKHDLHIVVDDPLFQGIQTEAERAALCASSWARMVIKEALRQQSANFGRSTPGDKLHKEVPYEQSNP